MTYISHAVWFFSPNSSYSPQTAIKMPLVTPLTLGGKFGNSYHTYNTQCNAQFVSMYDTRPVRLFSNNLRAVLDRTHSTGHHAQEYLNYLTVVRVRTRGTGPDRTRSWGSRDCCGFKQV